MTLKDYRNLCIVVFGADSPQVRFIDDKIRDQGEDMEVLTDERQMLLLLSSLS